jgi:hypothetical protein
MRVAANSVFQPVRSGAVQAARNERLRGLEATASRQSCYCKASMLTFHARTRTLLALQLLGLKVETALELRSTAANTGPAGTCPLVGRMIPIDFDTPLSSRA